MQQPCEHYINNVCMLLLAGLFENYLQVKFKDPSLQLVMHVMYGHDAYNDPNIFFEIS